MGRHSSNLFASSYTEAKPEVPALSSTDPRPHRLGRRFLRQLQDTASAVFHRGRKFPKANSSHVGRKAVPPSHR